VRRKRRRRTDDAVSVAEPHAYCDADPRPDADTHSNAITEPNAVAVAEPHANPEPDPKRVAWHVAFTIIRQSSRLSGATPGKCALHQQPDRARSGHLRGQGVLVFDGIGHVLFARRRLLLAKLIAIGCSKGSRIVSMMHVRGRRVERSCGERDSATRSARRKPR
jgi:hypothetical protein